jgi:hypothetical protein
VLLRLVLPDRPLALPLPVVPPLLALLLLPQPLRQGLALLPLPQVLPSLLQVLALLLLLQPLQ